jgi:hypothetical protein
MMQIDRIELSKKNHGPKVRIGSDLISQKYLESNEKITDYQEGKPCPKCKMIKDPGEKGECKYCTGEFNEG